MRRERGQKTEPGLKRPAPRGLTRQARTVGRACAPTAIIGALTSRWNDSCPGGQFCLSASSQGRLDRHGISALSPCRLERQPMSLDGQTCPKLIRALTRIRSNRSKQAKGTPPFNTTEKARKSSCEAIPMRGGLLWSAPAAGHRTKGR